MTALAAPAAGGLALPAAGSGIDRAIRASTAAVVLAVAGIAAYISWWHAYAVVREYGESGVTAALEPATIDGLVYASSMVILYAARHRLPVPRLARWMLALGIAASLAVNVAQGWSHGLIGAVVAAWPAVALVGSYELLAWMIRTAAVHGPARAPVADQRGLRADQPGTSLPAAASPAREAGSADTPGYGAGQAPEDVRGPLPVARAVALVRGPGRDGPDHAGGSARSGPDRADRVGGPLVPAMATGPASDINIAAVAAYRVSIREGTPLSERKLAEAFGTTSRRWARNRMAEARKSPVPA